MELRVKGFGLIATLYLAPVSDKGWLAWWPGKHSSYEHGFVVRLLCLGFVVRWGKKKAHSYVGRYDLGDVDIWDFCD